MAVECFQWIDLKLGNNLQVLVVSQTEALTGEREKLQERKVVTRKRERKTDYGDNGHTENCH